MKYDLGEKRYYEEIPLCDDGMSRMKNFSISHKWRVSSIGYRNYPIINGLRLPYDGYCEKYIQMIRFNKKRWAMLPFID